MNIFFLFFQKIIFLISFETIKSNINNILNLNFNHPIICETNKTDNNNTIIFKINEQEEFYNDYFVHIYIINGELSLYGMKNQDLDDDLNDFNMFKQFKRGNIIFSNKINRNINLYIFSDKILDTNKSVIFYAICQENDANCTFKIEVNKIDDNKKINYNLSYNEEFYISKRTDEIKFNFDYKDNNKNNNNALVIDITSFFMKLKPKDIFTHIKLQSKNVSNNLKLVLDDLNNFNNSIELVNEEESDTPNFFKIKYYFRDKNELNNNYEITNNELFAFVITNKNIKDYSINITKFISKTDKIYLLIYSVNTEIKVSENNIESEGKFILFEKDYPSDDITQFKFKISMPEYEDAPYNYNTMLYAASFTKDDNYIILHTNEKLGFKFQKNIEKMNFIYALIYEEASSCNLYLEVSVPPLCEITLNVYVYKQGKYLILSKKINTKNVFYLSEASRICEPEEECLIYSEISQNLTPNDDNNLIYIQYLNNFGPEQYLVINKVSKEFSIQNKDIIYTNYTYQIKPNQEYELHIHFEKRPKKVEVYLKGEKSKEIINVNKNGRYIIKGKSNTQEYLIIMIENNFYSSSFTYYLREKNHDLEIISNENIHGYFSEEENNCLNYIYIFEDNLESFNLEIFSYKTVISIKDITEDGKSCYNYNYNLSNSVELLVIKRTSDCSPKKNRKIKITFKYNGKSESMRFLRFRILPNNYTDRNIIFLNQGEDAICEPINNLCYFYCRIPQLTLDDSFVSIHGYYENSYSKDLPLYAEQIIIKEKLSFEYFNNFYNMTKNQPMENNYYLIDLISKNYKVNQNNYVIGFCKTDNNSKIRLEYTISQKNSELYIKNFIISPGEEKYYSFLGKKGYEAIILNLEDDPNNYTDYYTLLYLTKINRKFNLLYEYKNALKKTKSINVEEILVMDVWNEFTLNKGEDSGILLSSEKKVPCSFKLKFELMEKENNLFHLIMNKPFVMNLNNIKYPLNFYLPISENIFNLIINFKLREQDYLKTQNRINIDLYDLLILLVDEEFISNCLYQNFADINRTQYNNNTIKYDHYIIDLFTIDYLTAEQIFLISFKNLDSIDNNILKKYNIIFLSLKSKEINKNKKEENNIKIQIISIRNNENINIPQNKYFYTFFDYHTLDSNQYLLKLDNKENYYIVCISSEEIKFFNISFINKKNSKPISFKNDNSIMKGHSLYYLEVNEKINYVYINITLKEEFKKNSNNETLFYSIKYYTGRNYNENKMNDVIPKYVFNKKNNNSTVFYISYNNLKKSIYLRWSILLNDTDDFSYVESRYILKFFDCDSNESINNKICNNNNNAFLSTFPNKYKEIKDLFMLTSTEEYETIINKDEFNYKIMLFAYFEDDLGEEIIYPYDIQNISYKYQNLVVWIIVVACVFLSFLVISIIILCLKIREEKKYYENEKEKLTLNSFSNEKSKEIDEDNLLKLE